jgi:RHS repeat-associated protein
LSGDDSEISSVSYLGKHFEIREHDAPTKYVWNGETRVARVTGSISPASRVQRLRVWPGWNLVSTAVSASLSAAEGDGPGEVVRSAFKWNAGNKDWLPVVASELLPSGTILWLQSTSTATLRLVGPYSQPTNQTITTNGDFLPGAGLEVWSLRAAFSNLASIAVQAHDDLASRWFVSLPFSQSSGFSEIVAPGKASFVIVSKPYSLDISQPSVRVTYYHGDHLNSSTYISDATGYHLVLNTYYPFGHPRHILPFSTSGAHYTFTGKEQDSETAFYNVESRLLCGSIARFSSVDSFGVRDHPNYLPLVPQLLNTYAWVANRPIRFVDPDGRYPTEKRVMGIDVAFSGNVHEASVGRALNGRASNSDISLLRRAVTAADADQWQDAANSFRHAMRSPSQTVDEAKEKANKFIANLLQAAAWHEAHGNHELAMERVGTAMHVLQDSASPEHHGFQIWRGEKKEGTIGGAIHGMGELFDPGAGSSLDKATSRIWDAWEWARAGGRFDKKEDFFRGINADSLPPPSTLPSQTPAFER